MKTIQWGILLLACAAGFYLLLPKGEKKEDLRVVRVPRVSFYHYFSGALSGGMQQMVDRINRKHPSSEIVAHALDHEAYKSMILSATSGDRPPEMFAYWSGMRVQNLVEKGVLAPLDEVWARHRLDACFPPSIVESACTYQGRKYLVPVTQYVVVFFYDKKRFADLGLTPPTTWQAFLETCRTLKANGIQPLALGARERWPAQFWFDYLLLRTAGPAYRRRLMQGPARYTDPEVERAYALWKDLIVAGYFNEDAAKLDWAEATCLLCARKAGMTLMGTWALQTLQGGECPLKPGEDFDFFPFPTINSNLPDVAVGPVDGVVLPKNSPSHGAALDVLPRFVDREVQQIMSRGSGCLAPSTLVPKAFYAPLNARLWEMVHKTPRWAFNYDLATPAPIAEVGMNSFLEMLAFPRQFRAILTDVDQQVESIRSQQQSEEK